MRLTLCTLTTVMTAPACVLAPDAGACGVPEQWLVDAVSEDAEQAAAARAGLRDFGPWALKTLTARYVQELAAYEDWLAKSKRGRPDPLWARLTAAIDAVGGQRDNFVSQLYWYTDLEHAKRASAAQGRPILSLRLLGRLDEDLSCANSRFFRTALYANAAIVQTLRQHFVLHWQTVRPVPRITIDFGDGREMCRTITGNSLHYVLDAEGRPLDALPGLHGPGAFDRWLDSMRGLHAEITEAAPQQRWVVLSRFHDQRLTQLEQDWAREAAAAGIRVEPAAAAPDGEGVVLAERAALVAVTKSVIESPILAALRPSAVQLDEAMTSGAWKQIALQHLADAQIDASSRRLMRAKTSVTRAMVRRFEQSIALDTVRNEYRLHRQVHEWFVQAQADSRIGSLDELTDRIYAELFLTPAEDPWLGLMPPDTYAALDGNGVSR